MAVDKKPSHVWRWLIGLVILPALIGWHFMYNRVPGEIKIATGAGGGLYHQFAEELKYELEAKTRSTVSVVETQGTDDNRQRLINGAANLAILQAGPGSVEGVVALAPLYHDVVFVVVRRDLGIRTPRDLAGHSVVVGLPGSGMRASAMALLEHYGVDGKSARCVERYFLDLLNDETLDAAIITAGFMNHDLAELLDSEKYDIIEIDEASALCLKNSSLVEIEIPHGLFGDKSPLPAHPVKDYSDYRVFRCPGGCS